MKNFLLIAVFSLLLSAANAQINYSFAASSGTYTPISGTAVTFTPTGYDGTAGGLDEGYNNSIALGFTFPYNGVNYTTVGVTSNGFLYFGAGFTATATFYNNNLTSGFGTSRPLVAPLWGDLLIGSATYTTTGSAGSRVFTMQWNNVKWDYAATAPVISFQVQLYEASGLIKFVYNQEAGTVSSGAYASIGLSALGTGGGNFMSLSSSGTAPTASTTTETTDINTKPATGQTYTFTPVAPVPNDISVNLVYALGKAGQGVANSVKANVRNLGTSAGTNVVFTLNVTGANTYTTSVTVPTIASGAGGTLTFPNIALPNVGANTITISTISDENNSNNSASTAQEITTNQLSYAVGTAVVAGINAGAGNEIAAKFGVPYPAKIATVNVTFSASGEAYDLIIYNNVAGAPGTAIGTVTGLTTTLGLNNITLPTPVNVSDSFYIAFRQTGTSLPVSYQTETPLRTNTFFLKSGINPWFDLSGNPSNIYRLMIGLTTVTALPLQLQSFNGQLKGNNANLSWSTTSEVNVDRFEIERSSNSSTWSSIGTVAAKGAASNTYQLTDANLTAGKWLYRLKMVDRDGSFSYSRIVTLDLNGKSLFVLNQNYPNPVKGSTQLSYQVSTDAKVMIVLLANDGRQIATLVNQQQGIGSYNVSVDLSKYNLASGNYLYRMIALDNNNQELFQSTKTITVVQ